MGAFESYGIDGERLGSAVGDEESLRGGLADDDVIKIETRSGEGDNGSALRRLRGITCATDKGQDDN